MGGPAVMRHDRLWRTCCKAAISLSSTDASTPPSSARTRRAAIRAAGLRLGLSSHGYAEMLRADRVSPSYIAMGAVFPTTLKNMPTAPQGLGRLEL